MRAARTQLLLVPLLASLLVGSALVASCGGGSNKTESPTSPASTGTQAQGTAQAGGASIAIEDFEFTPDQVTVKVGETVTWTNAGPSTHTVTADDGSFDSGELKEGETYTRTFEAAGTVSYHCSIHPSMKAEVVVEE